MTTPPHQPTDRWRELDDDAGSSDVTREFWGAGGDWSNETPRPDRTTEEHRGLAATVSRWWNSTGSIPATRVHGRPTTEIPVQSGGGDAASFAAQDDTDELGLEDWLVDAWSDESPHRVTGTDFGDFDPYADPVDATSDDDHESALVDPWNAPAPTAPRPMIDPLLARIGAVAILMTLLVPALLGFVSDSDEGDALRTATEPATADPSLVAAASSVTAAVVEPVASSTEAVAAAPAADPGTTPTAAPTSSAAAATTTPDNTEPVAAQLTVDTCSTDYEVVAGDFWIRIADGSGAPLADLLAVNDATVSTPLYPGSTICLPAGATAPPAPPSTSTSSGSSSQSSPTTAAPAPTSPPPTTAAPTTTSAPLPPASNATAAEVQAIIRAVWPDDLEERALQIAWRESNYVPTAKNYCCYGLFQIYWSVHKSWLSGMGITSAEQLYDPTTNARAALALYERAGGWGPWGG